MTDGLERLIFEAAEALRVPVLLLALASLLLVLYELGAFATELVRRRRRATAQLERSIAQARRALDEGNRTYASALLKPVASSAAMEDAFTVVVTHARLAGGADRVARALADFDYGSMRRLERTRLLVRAGPALGLMGTLIPLSPALGGLARGDVGALSSNLRVAFSVTVLGILIGGAAFAVSLVRDRLYGQDLSDLEFVANALVVEPA